MLEHSNGFYWPKGTRQEIKDLIYLTVADMQSAVDLTRAKRVAVQAGGNVGCWPKWLAERFDDVVTFEPELNNFEALQANVHETNVYKYQVALGEKRGLVGMRLSSKNIGAHRVEGFGDIPMITLDSLTLGHCDLLVLDVEGYEFPVLRGGLNMIKRCSPVIMLEDRGLSKKTGNGKFSEIVNWLRALGYEEKARLQYDAIFSR